MTTRSVKTCVTHSLLLCVFRSLLSFSHSAMKRMAASNVLIVGLKGLGVEIGKSLRIPP